MKTWHERALELEREGYRPIEIHGIIAEEYGEDIPYNRVKCYLYKKRSKTPAKLQKKMAVPEKKVVIQNQEPERHVAKWDGAKVIRFGLIGDTQFGSKYAQITHLHTFYDICQREGITDVYHTGDLTDGLKMRVGHEYELYEHSADGQIDDVVANYPKRDGITTHFITGNHDASLYKQVGMDVGRAISRQRPDMHYLGRDAAVVNLTPNCTLELRHPWDGVSYAVSYRLQKMIESMESDSKPNIFAVGHYHKELTMFYRNVHGILTASFQAQTPFLRGKGIASILGGFIVTVRVDDDGTILGCDTEFIPFYKSITDDYKNYWRK